MRWLKALGIVLLAGITFGVGFQLGADTRGRPAPSEAVPPELDAVVRRATALLEQRVALLKEGAELRKELAATRAEAQKLQWWIDHIGPEPGRCDLPAFSSFLSGVPMQRPAVAGR